MSESSLQALVNNAYSMPKPAPTTALAVPPAPVSTPAVIKDAKDLKVTPVEVDKVEIKKEKPEKPAMPQGGWGKAIASWKFTGWGQLLDGRNKAGATQFFTGLGAGVVAVVSGIVSSVGIAKDVFNGAGLVAKEGSRIPRLEGFGKMTKIAGAVGALAMLVGAGNKIYSVVDAYKGPKATEKAKEVDD